VGPGRTLSTLIRQRPGKPEQAVVLASLRSADEQRPDLEYLLNTLGGLWQSGVAVDWAAFYAHERRRRIPLPTYPFERKRYWVDAPTRRLPAETAGGYRSDEDSCILTTGTPMITNGNGKHATTVEMATSAATASTPAPPETRQERVLARLQVMLRDLSGEDLSGADAAASFLELGFDSLFLTQAKIG